MPECTSSTCYLRKPSMFLSKDNNCTCLDGIPENQRLLIVSALYRRDNAITQLQAELKVALEEIRMHNEGYTMPVSVPLQEECCFNCTFGLFPGSTKIGTCGITGDTTADRSKCKSYSDARVDDRGGR